MLAIATIKIYMNMVSDNDIANDNENDNDHNKVQDKNNL